MNNYDCKKPYKVLSETAGLEAEGSEGDGIQDGGYRQGHCGTYRPALKTLIECLKGGS
jgi:hypothetical protein